MAHREVHRSLPCPPSYLNSSSLLPETVRPRPPLRSMAGLPGINTRPLAHFRTTGLLSPEQHSSPVVPAPAVQPSQPPPCTAAHTAPRKRRTSLLVRHPWAFLLTLPTARCVPVPLTSMTGLPGTNIRLLGLGVGCVWMNMLRREPARGWAVATCNRVRHGRKVDLRLLPFALPCVEGRPRRCAGSASAAGLC